jgi:hypothetical protein
MVVRLPPLSPALGMDCEDNIKMNLKEVDCEDVVVIGACECGNEHFGS